MNVNDFSESKSQLRAYNDRSFPSVYFNFAVVAYLEWPNPEANITFNRFKLESFIITIVSMKASLRRASWRFGKCRSMNLRQIAKIQTIPEFNLMISSRRSSSFNWFYSEVGWSKSIIINANNVFYARAKFYVCYCCWSRYSSSLNATFDFNSFLFFAFLLDLHLNVNN